MIVSISSHKEPVSRRDEIGLLAQTLVRTYDGLRHERERRRAERYAARGKIAASLTHEVRNPLTAIRQHRLHHAPRKHLLVKSCCEIAH